MKKVTVGIRTTFSYLGQVFNAVGLAQRNKTFFSLKSVTSTFRGTSSFHTNSRTGSYTDSLLSVIQQYCKKICNTMFSPCQNILRRNTRVFVGFFFQRLISASETFINMKNMLAILHTELFFFNYVFQINFKNPELQLLSATAGSAAYSLHLRSYLQNKAQILSEGCIWLASTQYSLHSNV